MRLHRMQWKCDSSTRRRDMWEQLGIRNDIETHWCEKHI